jgi:hypothetical protein
VERVIRVTRVEDILSHIYTLLHSVEKIAVIHYRKVCVEVPSSTVFRPYEHNPWRKLELENVRFERRPKQDEISSLRWRLRSMCFRSEWIWAAPAALTLNCAGGTLLMQLA